MYAFRNRQLKSKMAGLHNLYVLMKYLMMILSFIILVSGLVLLGVGIWINVGTTSFIKSVGEFSSQLGIVSNILAVAGAGLSLLGFIGCYGAWAEKRSFILVFFVVVSLVFLAEIVMALIVLIYQQKVANIIREASKQTLIHSYKGPGATDAISVAWNALMLTFKCCGVENTTSDFVGSTFTNNTGLLYPQTCCVNPASPSCDGVNTSPGILHTSSCDVKIIHFMKSQSIIMGSTAAVICVLELAAMMISVVLYVRLGSSGYHV
ncbi:hypothetical protein ACEWY4_017180 [Coilia grayii]|uniref:Tetraspanin n=1 Tax=Coilia grayii TaxID=363190 RepID=A0ABD1JJ11_9TELE